MSTAAILPAVPANRDASRQSAYVVLMRIHDHIWRDRNWSLRVRIASCQQVLNLAFEVDKQKWAK